jgi:hypothetical protein
MDATDVALIVVGVLGTIAILWAGFLLDRRSQRAASAKWMRAWTILTRVRNDLFNRLHGPLRLQDRRAEAAPKTQKRKAATPRRKGTRKQTRFFTTDHQD